MPDPQLDGLFASLEAAYDAAAARADEEAAADLAFGFAQDRPLKDELCARGHLLLSQGGATAPVVIAGLDYLVAGRAPAVIVPIRNAELVGREDIAPARTTDARLVTVLRRLARRGTQVELMTPTGVRAGRLVSASPEHILLEGRLGRWVVGSEALRAVSLPSQDSMDAL